MSFPYTRTILYMKVHLHVCKWNSIYLFLYKRNNASTHLEVEFPLCEGKVTWWMIDRYYTHTFRDNAGIVLP